jgi:hypothetical protein
VQHDAAEHSSRQVLVNAHNILSNKGGFCKSCALLKVVHAVGVTVVVALASAMVGSEGAYGCRDDHTALEGEGSSSGPALKTPLLSTLHVLCRERHGMMVSCMATLCMSCCSASAAASCRHHCNAAQQAKKTAERRCNAAQETPSLSGHEESREPSLRTSLGTLASAKVQFVPR